MDRGGRRWFPLVAAAAVLVVAFAVIWAAAPDDLRGLILVVGGAITAATYAAVYVLQRHIHW